MADYFKVRTTAVGTAATGGGSTQIPYNTVVSDPAGLFDTTNNRFVVTAALAGPWVFLANSGVNGLSNEKVSVTEIYVNGAQVEQDDIGESVAAGSVPTNCNTGVVLADGDIVTWKNYNNDTGNAGITIMHQPGITNLFGFKVA